MRGRTTHRQTLVNLQAERSRINRRNINVGIAASFLLIPAFWINVSDAPEVEQYAIAGRLGQGSTTLVDGVQIIYREGNHVLQSAQVGLPCEFAPGPALVTVTQSEETLVQSNHTCIKGQEKAVGRVSNLQGLGTIEASDQQTLDDLERQRALIRKQQDVQSAKTGLARETARTESAKTKVDLELETHRSVNTATKDGAKNPPTVVIK